MTAMGRDDVLSEFDDLLRIAVTKVGVSSSDAETREAIAAAFDDQELFQALLDNRWNIFDKSNRFIMIDQDGERFGLWHDTERLAISAAIAHKEKTL